MAGFFGPFFFFATTLPTSQEAYLRMHRCARTVQVAHYQYVRWLAGGSTVPPMGGSQKSKSEAGKASPGLGRKLRSAWALGRSIPPKN